MKISVIIAAHNPHRERLRSTLSGLAAQSMPHDQWETIIVDNASSPLLDSAACEDAGLGNVQITRESALGLTPARVHGICRARGELVVFVDDDNVLDPNYLEAAHARFGSSARLGAAGGPVTPRWEQSPPDWTESFHGLLALRDFGREYRLAHGAAAAAWPDFAPVGAGLVVRRLHALRYAAEVAQSKTRRSLDRTSSRLSSGGDCDLVFTVLHGGADVAYDPALRVTHLIPAARLAPPYLARLNRGIMRSWVSVLAVHGQCPWPPIARASVPLRAARAWFRRRAWGAPENRVRWAGDLGQFEGQADLREEGIAP